MLNGSIKTEVANIDAVIKHHEDQIKRLAAAKGLLLQAVDVLKEDKTASTLADKAKKSDKAAEAWFNAKPPVKKVKKTTKLLRKEGWVESPKAVETKEAKPQPRTEAHGITLSGGYKPWAHTPNWPEGVYRGTKVDVRCIDGSTLTDIIAGAVNWRQVDFWRLHSVAQAVTEAMKQEDGELRTLDQVVEQALAPMKTGINVSEVIVKRRPFGSDLGNSVEKVTFHREGTKTNALCDAVERKLRQYRRPMRTKELVQVLYGQKSTKEYLFRQTRKVETLHAMLTRDARFKNLGMHKGGWTLA